MTTFPLLAASDDSKQWIMYGLIALPIVYFLVVRPMLRKSKDPLEKFPSIGLSQHRTVEREMSNLLVELSEMARQITAQLDTRSAKLQALIQEADQRIARLQQSSAAPPAPTTDAATEQPSLDQRHMDVYALADQGRSPDQIAQQLNRPKGEVELILALRRKA
jgi:small-conductance mechanosensitive channel